MVPCEETDTVLNLIIAKYKNMMEQKEKIEQAICGTYLTKAQLSRISIDLLYNIIRHNKNTAPSPSKKQCIDILKDRPYLFYEYFGIENTVQMQ